MNHKQRKVVTSSSSISSCSLPCSPIQHPTTFLMNTPVPKSTLLTWKQGISTPIHEGNLSPNHLAVELLAGFSTGKIRMRGDIVEHRPSSEADESIVDMLSQLDSATHHEDQEANNSASHISPIVTVNNETKMIARLQAEKNPRTKVPDSEIRPENIILGSPMYIPNKKISKNQKGKGGYGKKLKFPIYSSSMMPWWKKMPTQKELVNAARARKLAGGSGKPHKSATFSKSAYVPQTSHAPHKGGGGGGAPVPPMGGLKKPKKHKPRIVALCEICHFQKSVNLLIPLPSFGRLIREVAQDYKVGLKFQSSALMVIQEAAETYLVNLFEVANLCAIHRKRQTIAPKDFGLVKAIRHISGINLWWH